MKVDKLYIAGGLTVALVFAVFRAEAQITTGSPGATVNSPTTAAASAAAAASALQGQGQLQGQLQGNVGLGAGNTTSTPVTVNNPPQTVLQYQGGYDVKNVPNVVVPNIYPTAPCMGSTAVGGSVVGFGIAAGTSWVYENCEHRENARLLQAFGDIPNAKIALCMQTTMAAHPMCVRPAQLPAKVSDARGAPIVDSERQRRATEIGLTVGQDGTLWKCVSNDKGSCDWMQAKMDPIGGNIR